MRALFTAALLWYGVAFSALAQPFPQLYDVTGVAADDVLNVRVDPSASSAIVGQLAPQQKSIEVVASAKSGKWGLVNIGERSGWVAMRFLRRQAGDPDYALGRELRCYGTEPFWSLHVVQGRSAVFSAPDDTETISSAGLVTAGSGWSSRFVLGLGDNGVAILRRAQCDDGMSDRAFGIEIDLLPDRGAMTLYSGCCSIAPQ